MDDTDRAKALVSLNSSGRDLESLLQRVANGDQEPFAIHVYLDLLQPDIGHLALHRANFKLIPDLQGVTFSGRLLQQPGFSDTADLEHRRDNSVFGYVKLWFWGRRWPWGIDPFGRGRRWIADNDLEAATGNLGWKAIVNERRMRIPIW